MCSAWSRLAILPIRHAFMRPFFDCVLSRFRRLAPIILLLSLLSAESFASDDAGLLADAADGRLDHIGLLDAAVIAGGGDRSDVLAVGRKLEALWLEVREPLIDKLSDADRPRAIFSALHRL